MAKSQEPSGSRGLDILLILAGVVALVLVVMTLMTWTEYSELSEQYPHQRERLESLFEIEGQIKEIKRKNKGEVFDFSSEEVKVNTVFENLAREAGMGQKSLDEVNPSKRTREKYIERKWQVKLKETNIQQLVRFVYLVEEKVPAAKATDITVPTFQTTGQIKGCTVTFMMHEPTD